ncbi:MAG TPA: molybdopterin-binding protein [Rhodocyclaceae bacterium]|jgi:molybdopterin-biosynthesis enzyme MoeA-like protein|nr:competence/damage-inducible protein A [Betaproteobacteria bacterium]HMV00929.1 molybdopterin-binding protein [Rhodocyclaceae bacterium]HMV20257.1 molybdopterin-binding protein [Rhodocyclaceae bacterium]HMW76515.1 molybdopterin-binding protein [Rhodocyclaceae bacterium]HNE43824.1 molybdopterin-binding protein [Rhodocyclaceae bacterium]
MSEQRVFGAVIIGDEILSGKRQDKHFERIAAMLGERGLRLSWVEYLGDERQRLAETFRRTLASGDVVFSCGGIGNTPDDHTRQAAAAALGVGLEIHPEGVEEAKIRFGDDMTPQRLQLVTFPAGAGIIPNPFNRIPGFMAREHYFVPGFPQMAHPMIEWVLDSFYKDLFQPAAAKVDKAFLLTGPTAYESALLDLMERIVAQYPTLRLFSLPSIQGVERRHLELGVEGDPALVDRAMEDIRVEVERRGITWRWRDPPA